MQLPEEFSWVDRSDSVFSETIDRITDFDDNLCIIGPAGVGKSLLIKIASKCLKGNVALCSTTGISAVALASDGVKSSTLHSLLRLKPLPYYPANLIVRDLAVQPVVGAIDTLIIDECSMLSSHIYDTIFHLLVLYTGAVSKLPRIILFSDILQLPPVVNADDEYTSKMYKQEYNNKIMFFNSHFFKDTDFKIIHLTKLQRQKDEHFQGILNRIRLQEQTQLDLDELNEYVYSLERFNKEKDMYIYLGATNKVVESVNTNYYNLFEGEATTYTSVIKDQYDDKLINPMDRIIRLKPNMQIMCTKNNKEFNYQNGSLGKVIQCLPDGVEVELKNGYRTKVQITKTANYKLKKNEKDELEYNEIGSLSKLDCRASKAISVHKSQGSTLDCAFIDVGSYQYCDSLVYVALSRLKTIDGIGLKKPLKMTDICANKESLEFLETIWKLE